MRPSRSGERPVVVGQISHQRIRLGARVRALLVCPAPAACAGSVSVVAAAQQRAWLATTRP